MDYKKDNPNYDFEKRIYYSQTVKAGKRKVISPTRMPPWGKNMHSKAKPASTQMIKSTI